MGITAIATKLQAFSFTRTTEQLINEYPDKVTDLVKQQLLDGKAKDGSFLRPFMDEDPFFKKPGAWQRYAQWKQRMWPSSVRPFNVPNLIIVGVYHSGIQAHAADGQIDYVNTSRIAGEVESKFNPGKTMGLDTESVEKYRRQTLYPELAEALNAAVL